MTRSCSLQVGSGWWGAGVRDASPWCCCCCCCRDMAFGGDGDGEDDSYDESVSWSDSRFRANLRLCLTESAIFFCLDSYCLTDYCPNQKVDDCP